MQVLTGLAIFGLVTACTAQGPVLAEPQVVPGSERFVVNNVVRSAPVLTDFDGDGRVDLLITTSVKTLFIGVQFHRGLPKRPGDKGPRFAVPVFVKAAGKQINLPLG